MNKIANAASAAWTAIKAYPHGVALLISVGVIMAAKFGFHVTPDELVSIAGALSVGVAAYTHKTMVSKSALSGS
jgi:hypothetical protein